MVSHIHAKHILSRVSHNNCSECRADTERRFVPVEPWREYKFVSEYLAYVRPRLSALDGTAEANQWYRKFSKALHTRITLRVPAVGRKHSAGYLERLRGMNRCHDVAYLLECASTRASALEPERAIDIAGELHWARERDTDEFIATSYAL